jgi:hypothetical protein
MKLVTVPQYAKLKGISRQAVIKQIDTGKLNAEKVGRYYIIKLKPAK